MKRVMTADRVRDCAMRSRDPACRSPDPARRGSSAAACVTSHQLCSARPCYAVNSKHFTVNYLGTRAIHARGLHARITWKSWLELFQYGSFRHSENSAQQSHYLQFRFSVKLYVADAGFTSRVCFRIDFENYIGLVMAQCAEISRRVGLAEPLHLIFMEGVNELDSGILIKRKQSAMRCDQSR